jgi:hypothetical protein
MSSIRTQPNPRVASAITEQCDSTREKLVSVLEERFAELGRRMEHEVEAEVDERVATAVESASTAVRERARREAAEEFNQALRRLHACETDEAWRMALVDASAGFCPHTALVAVVNESLRVLRVRGMEEAPAAVIPVQSAPAIVAAIESGGAVVTLVSPAELSEPVAQTLRAANAAKCAIVPVVVDGETCAVLIGAGEAIDVNGLEAIATLAGTARERRLRRTPETAASPAAPAPAAEAEAAAPVLSPEEEALRLRAQRFARVRAAEIRLYKAPAVRDGRASRTLYTELKEEIDAARVAYARQFLHASSTMPDYLHQEFLRTLANDEIAALGEDYPGPLV